GRARGRAGAADPLRAEAVEGGVLIELDRDVFAAYFDKKPFHIRHSLGEHPLFALPRLMELARALPDAYVEYNAGILPVGVRPDETPRNGPSLAETVRRIAG